jgi:diguanylate cyclase (GGDEF)-like protein
VGGACVSHRNRGLSLCIIIAVLLLSAAPATPVHAFPLGEPPVTRFAPDVDADLQNFAIAQDSAATIYVGNGRGVLSFDGNRWELIPLPNGDLVRTLAYDGGSRVYVGGYNCFGYLERDDAGAAHFHDLSTAFKPLLGGEDFADIWSIQITPQGVFFGAVRHLFLYRPDGGPPRLWRHPGRFGALAQAGGEILAQFRGEGLRVFRNGDWQAIAGTGDLQQLIFRWVPLPDGGLLSLAADGRWYEWIGGHAQDFHMPAGSPPSSMFTDGKVLADGSLALSGNDGTLRLLDPQHRHWHSLHVDSGWLSGLIAVRDGGVLTAGNLAVFHVGLPAAWTVIGQSAGFGGDVIRLRRWGSRWFALTDSGAYQAEPAAAQDAASAFRRLDWTVGEAWDLLPLDAGHALFAESYKLQWIDGTGLHALADHGDLYPRLLQRSRFDPAVVYVGTEFGVALVQKQGGAWRLRIDRGSRATTVSSMAETAAGEVWIGSARDGVRRVRVAPDHSRILEDRAFGPAEGLRYGPVAEAAVSVGTDGTLIAATDAGLFRWNGSRFVDAALDGLAALRHDGELLTLASPGAGGANADEWAFGTRRVYHRPQGQAWHSEEIGDILDGGIQTIAFDDAGVALLGCTGTILRYDPAQAPAAGGAPAIRLQSLTRIEPDGSSDRLVLHPGAAPRFVRGDFDLAFRFSLADYRSQHGALYQGRLIGHDSSFGGWSRATNYVYKHLEPGDYAFVARGLDSRGRISQTEPYRFSIAPPWYAMSWARALWALLLGGAIAGLGFAASGLRLRRMQAAQRRLERLVAERTRELETANRRLDELAHLDGLTEIANRRGLETRLRESWQRCGDNGRPIALMVIDVDHFKSYNDRHGHLAGDAQLKNVVAQLSQCLRRSEDMVGRYGGDEFVAVLPGADLAFACEVAEAMRQQVRQAGLGTISVGVAARQPRPGEAVTALLHEADEALYESKRQGRDRVSAYGKSALA